jgi:hypothetical protein
MVVETYIIVHMGKVLRYTAIESCHLVFDFIHTSMYNFKLRKVTASTFCIIKV